MGWGGAQLSLPTSRENQTLGICPCASRTFLSRTALSLSDAPEMLLHQGGNGMKMGKISPNKGSTSTSLPRIHPPGSASMLWANLILIFQLHPPNLCRALSKGQISSSLSQLGDNIYLPDSNQLDPHHRHKGSPRRAWAAPAAAAEGDTLARRVCPHSVCTWSSGMVPAPWGWQEQSRPQLHTEHRSPWIFGMFGILGALPSS